MRLIVTLSLCASASVGVAAPEVGVTRYQIIAKMLVVEEQPGHELRVVAEEARLHMDRGQDEEKVVILPAVDELQIGDLRLDLTGERVLFDGCEEPPEGSGVEAISAPRITTQVGLRAAIKSSRALQHFEKLDDGTFALRSGFPAGLLFEVTPFRPEAQQARDAEMVELEVKLVLSVMTGREPIPGVNLDVGRPILKEREVESRYLLACGRWTLVTVDLFEDAAGESNEYLLVLFNVIRL